MNKEDLHTCFSPCTVVDDRWTSEQDMKSNLITSLLQKSIGDYLPSFFRNKYFFKWAHNHELSVSMDTLEYSKAMNICPHRHQQGNHTEDTVREDICKA